MNRPFVLVTLLAGCEVESTAAERQLLGTVETDDGPAEVWDSSTMFFYQEQSNGNVVMALLFSAAEDLSCADLAGSFPYSATGSVKDYDPRPANIAGSCTLLVNDPKWDGELAATLAEGDKTVEATVSLDCFPEGGGWVEGADGWEYGDGAVKWSARPTSFSLNVTGDEASGASWSVSLPTLEGKPYDELSDYAAITGSVSGEGEAAWCSDLADSNIFPG